MKHKEYIRGVITGVLAAAAVAAGACFGYTRLAGGVLSDSQHVQKLRFLEALIDQEYLGEKDEDSLAEGLYKGLIYGLGDVYSCYYTKEEYEQENSSTTAG